MGLIIAGLVVVAPHFASVRLVSGFPEAWLPAGEPTVFTDIHGGSRFEGNLAHRRDLITHHKNAYDPEDPYFDGNAVEEGNAPLRGLVFPGDIEAESATDQLASYESYETGTQSDGTELESLVVEENFVQPEADHGEPHTVEKVQEASEGSPVVGEKPKLRGVKSIVISLLFAVLGFVLVAIAGPREPGASTPTKFNPAVFIGSLLMTVSPLVTFSGFIELGVSLVRRWKARRGRKTSLLPPLRGIESIVLVTISFVIGLVLIHMGTGMVPDETGSLVMYYSAAMLTLAAFLVTSIVQRRIYRRSLAKTHHQTNTIAETN